MIRIPINTQYCFIREAHESWERDQRQISCPTSPHSTKPNPNLAQNWVFLGLFWPKMQLCRFVHCKKASTKLLLVHHEGAWVLRGESKTYFLPNLDTTKRDQPIIWSNIECVCRYFDQKYTYVGSYIVRVPIKNSSLPLLLARHAHSHGLLSLVAACRQASGSVTPKTSAGDFCYSCSCAKMTQPSPHAYTAFVVLFWFFCLL